MSIRGITQLKTVKMFFCDFGGSSKGVREFLKSPSVVEFVKDNSDVQFEFVMKRGRHPFIAAEYLNGFCKDVPLRNQSLEKVEHYLQTCRD